MRYPPLLIAVFIVMVLKPFAEHFRSFSVPNGFFLILTFLAVLYAFRHTSTFLLCLALLATSGVATRFAADHWQIPALLMLSYGVSFLVMVMVMVAILSEVLRAQTVSSDLVVGAVCLYLVVGLAWTFLYYWIYLLSPGSIFASPPLANLRPSIAETRFTEMLYFSFSALTTIGSSGEESVTTMTRQLAVVESAMGQLYLAVLISRLVGFHTSSSQVKT